MVAKIESSIWHACPSMACELFRNVTFLREVAAERFGIPAPDVVRKPLDENRRRQLNDLDGDVTRGRQEGLTLDTPSSS